MGYSFLDYMNIFSLVNSINVNKLNVKQAKGISVADFLKRQQHEILAQEAYGDFNNHLGHRSFNSTPGSMIFVLYTLF